MKKTHTPHLRTGVVSLLAIVMSLGGIPGCYHYRVTVPQPTPATDYEKETVHALVWGLIQQDTVAKDCTSNSLDEVRTTTNIGYQLVSVLTLGIWAPMDVEWRCAKSEPKVGTL